jgi:crossover junction endodeoxyribonuclease RuvC
LFLRTAAGELSAMTPVTLPPVRYILGVDPGLTGAIAFLTPSHLDLVTVDDMPVAGDAVNAAYLADRIMQMRPDCAMVELVGAMPGNGVSSMFKFGRAFGTVLGVLAALDVPTHFVTPAKWKKHFRLSADKDAARGLANRLWPAKAKDMARKMDAGRAEAALIARYAAETLPQFLIKTEGEP